MDFLNNIDLKRNELRNARVQNLATAPNNPVIGQIYYDTTADTLREYTADGWQNVGGEGHKYTFAEGETDGTFSVQEDESDPEEIKIHGLDTAAYKAAVTEITDEADDDTVPTAAAVKSYVDEKAAGGVHYKGTVGTGGTVEALPSDAESGDMYKVITVGTYAGQVAKVGDVFIKNGEAWDYIPSGDDTGAGRYSAFSPTLASSGGMCAWEVTHGLGEKYVAVNLFKADTGEMVLADVTFTDTSKLTVSFVSASTISAGTYGIVCVG